MSDAAEQRPVASRALAVRRALASAASLAVAAILARTFSARAAHVEGQLWLASGALIGAPLVAGASIWSGRLGLQLLARGIWWALLLLAGMLSVRGAAGMSVAAQAGASALALLIAGRSGLDDRGRFQPVAFRGTLMLALVLAIADTASSLWLGIAQTIIDGRPRLILFVPPMVAGVIGLLRLRTWGLLVSLVCNVLVVVLAGTNVLDLPPELRWLFIGTAAAQLLVPIPMWMTIVRRRPPPPDIWKDAKLIATTLVIVGIAVVCLYCALGPERYSTP